MKKGMLCAMLCMGGSLFLGGCSAPGFWGMTSFVYEDADKYTMGDAKLEAEGITSLDIGWVSGEVKVGYHSGDAVVISETANRETDDDTTMYYFVDGDTLRVKFAKSGKFQFTNLEKELTVWLPEGMELELLAIDSTSADVKVDALTAGKAEVDTVSGDIVMEGVTFFGTAAFASTSGGMNAEIGGALKSFSADTVSGDLEFALAAAEKLELNSTSGEIKVSVQEAPQEVSVDTVSGDVDLSVRGAGKVDINSTSGMVRAAAKEAFGELSVDTISGDVVLCLPEGAGFTVHMDSVSGSVESGLAMKKSGDDYIFGDGAKQYDVDTTSGDLRVEGAYGNGK